jgi:hypothetical protein
LLRRCVKSAVNDRVQYPPEIKYRIPYTAQIKLAVQTIKANKYYRALKPNGPIASSWRKTRRQRRGIKMIISEYRICSLLKKP